MRHPAKPGLASLRALQNSLALRTDGRRKNTRLRSIRSLKRFGLVEKIVRALVHRPGHDVDWVRVKIAHSLPQRV